MISPAPLQKGDTIAIVSTARAISVEELDFAVSTIEQWGFKVEKGPNLHGRYHQFSGTDEERLHDFQQALDNPDIKAILCARGGYGTVRIIDDINWEKFLNNPKWIAGYSDVSVLLNTLCCFGIKSLHSTMPINFSSNTEESLNSLKNCLQGDLPEYKFKKHPLNVEGDVEGVLIGGNLSMLYSQTGSASSLQTEGCILFLEDLDEYLYHIDRMMHNLRRNNYFKGLKGVVIGGMSDMNDNAVPFGFVAEEIIHHHLKELDIPIAFGFPAGHLNDNRCLIMGNSVRLKVNSSPLLKFL